jgi:phage/plasmid-like protein (TIGR03299 family)
MSILDEMVAAHESNGLVVGEQHDAANINTAGMNSPGLGIQAQIEALEGGGWWDEREYGITREAQIAKLKAALTPEAQAKELEEMRARAIGRAGLDDSSGRVSFAGVGGGWHGLGVSVSRAMTAAEARRLAALTWLVTKMPLYYKDPLTDLEVPCPDAFALTRDDTGACLGVVGPKYKPIQNDEGFDFLDGVLAEFGARYETAGAVSGGRRVWMLARLPKQDFAVNGKDKVESYVVFTNSHDGTAAARCFPTTDRVECRNTLRVAANRGTGKGISLRHTGGVAARIGDAQAALGLAVRGISNFADKAQRFAGVRVRKPEAYFHDVLDRVLEVTLAESKKGADVLAAALDVTEAERKLKETLFRREIERRGDILEQMVKAHEDRKNGLGGMRGTLWGTLNAVTQAADHGGVFRYTGSEEDRAGRKFESILTGPADELKQAAFEAAGAYAAKA